MSTSTNVTLALACLAASAVFAAPASAADNVSAQRCRPSRSPHPYRCRHRTSAGPVHPASRRPLVRRSAADPAHGVAAGLPEARRRDRSPMARAAARARLLHRAAARARLLHPDAARRAPRRRCRTCAARSRPTAESGLARGLQNRSDGSSRYVDWARGRCSDHRGLDRRHGGDGGSSPAVAARARPHRHRGACDASWRPTCERTGRDHDGSSTPGRRAHLPRAIAVRARVGIARRGRSVRGGERRPRDRDRSALGASAEPRSARPAGRGAGARARAAGRTAPAAPASSRR